jgi:hypothetical protein
VEKMVKQFAMANYLPFKCLRMLHRMDDHLHDVQTISNVFIKVNNIILEEKGMDTSSTKSQHRVDYRMTNPDTHAVIVIHDPSFALNRWETKRSA